MARPTGSSKHGATRKNTQRYYTTISNEIKLYLLRNSGGSEIVKQEVCCSERSKVCHSAFTSGCVHSQESTDNWDLKEARERAEVREEKIHSLESDLAVAEAENEDMLRQLEESKGLYLILEKKYHIAKNKVKELEERSVFPYSTNNNNNGNRGFACQPHWMAGQ